MKKAAVALAFSFALFAAGQNRGPSPRKTSATIPGTIPAIRPASSISDGQDHTCALQAKAIICWGQNDSG
jgi:hypothetical protein